MSTFRLALVLSAAALLSFLARTFIDYGFVYREFHVSSMKFALLTVVNLTFYAGWIWALIGASHRSRRAMIVLTIFDVILVLFGLVTETTLCPSPCRTAWPTGEIAIWSNLVIGIPAAVTTLRSALAKEPSLERG